MLSIDGLAGEVERLATLEVTGLSVADLQALTLAASRAAQRLEGVASRAVGELDVRAGGMVSDERGQCVPTPAWLRDALRTSGRDAGAAVRTAAALRVLPGVATAVAEGRISQAHAAVLSRLVGRFDEQLLRDTETDMLTVAEACDPERLSAWVRHLIATWCEPEHDAQTKAAHRRRYLQVTNQHDGTHRGRFVIPDEYAETVLTVLEALARRSSAEDERTAGQRRADALHEVFDRAARHDHLPDTGGNRPHVTLIVPEAAARGHRPAAEDFRAHVKTGLAARDGAFVATRGHTGPAPWSEVAARICDCRLSHAVLDVRGQVVSLTAPNDAITKAQRRAVAARDRTCTHQTCHRPAALCDVHHLHHRADGGPTTVDNLVLLCPRHHGAWHRGEIGLTDLRVPWMPLASPPP